MTLDYIQVALDKQKSLIDKIPKEWILSAIPSADEEPNVNTFLDKLLPENEKEITNKTAGQLVQLQESGNLTAMEIANAFCHRAALVHQLTNCCTEIFFERAFETAKSLDKYFVENRKLKGRLHGIPISLKDQINLPGITTALGYIAPHISEEYEKMITHRKSRNDMSLIAEILQQEGAVFYVKTTVPMAMLGNETTSNLSTTYNSIDRHNAAGGSSGGEASLLAGGGSIIGLGTDIGGSIRIPSNVQGIYGLRACSNRFPYLDIANSYPNQIAICSVVGPMAKNIDDLMLLSEVILTSNLIYKDPKVLPLKWNQSVFKENSTTFNDKIRLGFLKWDNEILPQPPILNNIEKLQKKITSSSSSLLFDCVQLDKVPVPFSKLANLIISLYLTDRFNEIEKFANLSGEPLPPVLADTYIRPDEEDTVSQFCDKAGLKYQYQVEFDKIFEKVDCFIMPTYAATSWKQGDFLNIGNYYTRAINVLDYTSMAFPVGVVTAEDTGYERTSFVNSMDEKNWKYFDLEKQIGKPVSLQLVCKRYHEEQCCAIVKKIQEILNQ